MVSLRKHNQVAITYADGFHNSCCDGHNISDWHCRDIRLYAGISLDNSFMTSKYLQNVLSLIALYQPVQVAHMPKYICKNPCDWLEKMKMKMLLCLHVIAS